jgi:hypothetical protein
MKTCYALIRSIAARYTKTNGILGLARSLGHAAVLRVLPHRRVAKASGGIAHTTMDHTCP